VPGSVRFCRFGTAATALAEGFVKLRLVGRIPTFIVAPNPHPDDRPFLKGARENWWPENHELTILANIGGNLEISFRRARPRPKARAA
jgi:hypothetical protein